MCTYPVQPCLHILLAVWTFFLLFAHSSAHPCLYYYLLSPQYTVLHILFHCTFYPLLLLLLLLCFYSYLFIYILLCYVSFLFLFFLHCPLSGPVLIYISLLIISCIIEYVTNKKTLNLEPLIQRLKNWTY